MDLKLKNSTDVIDSVKGKHVNGKSLIDVTGLLILRSNNKYLDSSIFEKFVSLKALTVFYFSLEHVLEGDFIGAQNLEIIIFNNNDITMLGDNIFSGASKLLRIEMKSNCIISVSSKTFAGLTSLRQINLNHNLLTHLPVDLFKDLTNLEQVSFDGNILESLDGDLFKHNLKLTHLWFSNNKLTVIGSSLLTQHKSLKTAYFYQNPCIHTSLYHEDSRDILNDHFAKCTESNKPEQKLIVAQAENKEVIEKNHNLSNEITELKKTNQEQNVKNLELSQNVVLLNQTIEVMHLNISTGTIDAAKCQEYNQVKITQLNQDLEHCQTEVKKTKFAFKCIH
ncbi:unnamed protein product [Diamesa serratosioi]